MDSLLRVIASKTSHDTSKISARYQLGEYLPIFRTGYWDTLRLDCGRLAIESKDRTIRKTIRRYQASSLNNLGYCYKEEGNFQKGVEYYNDALNLFEGIDDDHGVANCCNNLGLAYYSVGDIPKALTYYERAITIRETTSDHMGMGNTYNNIGLLYHSQNDTIKALEYYRKSLNERTLIDDHKGIAQSLNNIGTIFDDYGNYDSTRYYCQKSLDVCEAHSNQKGMAIALINLGNLYKKHHILDTALIYYFRSLEIRKKLGTRSTMAKSMCAIGEVYLDLGKNDSALSYGIRSLEISQEFDYPENIANAAQLLYKAYEKMGNGIKALEMYKLYITNRDRINNEESQQATAHQQARYQYEKQKALDDALHAHAIAIEEEKQVKQKIAIVSAIIGLVLVVVFLIFVFNRLRITRQQKHIIEAQKRIVENAHELLEHRNSEIMDSINYARRIQNAILPPQKLITQLLPDSFILYRPKDIVAGDFYWLEQKNDKILFAVADCTGHGVPGAMVSVVCNNGLNRSVREHNLTTPGKILEKTREIVIQEFEKSEDEVKDGMDISLCTFSGSTLQWAGANNPLWVVRENKLIEYKADKQPIGKYSENKHFTTHEIELQKGDALYMFSDGYYDQFGGPKGKKFKSSQMKELLLEINSESMTDQKRIIVARFENWKGDLEQIDDICIWGVRYEK